MKLQYSLQINGFVAENRIQMGQRIQHKAKPLFLIIPDFWENSQKHYIEKTQMWAVIVYEL